MAAVSDSQRAEGLDLPAIAGILRRRAWLIVLCVVLTAAAAVGLALRQDKQYEATASLLFRDPAFGQRAFGIDYGQTDSPERVLQTNLRLAELKVLAARTARRFGGGIAAGDVQAKVKLGTEEAASSDIATVTATDTDPDRAARLANTFAREFIVFRINTDRTKLRQARLEASREIAGLQSSGVDRQLIRELASTIAQLRVLEALQGANAELVEEASPPSEPSSPKPRRNGLIGGFLGLLLGLALALGREQLDRRLKHPDELEEQFGLPLLTSVPKSRELSMAGVNGSGPPMLPPVEGEAFRMLRANMRHFNPGREISSVLVTSPASKDGKSTVALNLAIAAAETGTHVLLLEADLRSPVIANFLGVYAEKGLTSLLTEPDLNLNDVGWRIPASHSKNGSSASAAEQSLDVIFAGPHVPNPTELLATNRMRELLREAEANYELVIVDAPPVTMVSDAIPLLSMVSGIIVVSRLGSNTRPLMKRLDEQLQRLETPALGLVANFATEHPPHYGYPYVYHYHKQDEPPRRRFRLLR
jgi:succinoglycan biosynthesis transport protein ExoP